jgi:hypothetical protein
VGKILIHKACSSQIDVIDNGKRKHSIVHLLLLRAIFRWITVKDLNVMEFEDGVNQDTPLGLLRGIKYGTETYHTLFMRLCRWAAVHCSRIACL